MGGGIVFYTRRGIVELGGAEYDAGALTTDLLNLSPKDYAPIHQSFGRVTAMAKEYEGKQELGIWWELNNELEKLSGILRGYKIFQAILPEDDRLFGETRMLTEKFSLFPEEDFVLGERDRELLARMDEEDAPVELTDALLICPGSKRDKWEYYRSAISRYGMYLHDIRAFNTTIRNFLNHYLRHLKHYSAESCAAALHDFFSDPRAAQKLIVSPLSFGGDCYTTGDRYETRYVPRPLPGETEGYAIYEEHRTNSLQAFLKADFMCSITAGYVIRRCLICERYFLLKKAYHTLYCDREAPMFPGYTCHQVGSVEGQKELARNTPKLQSKLRAFDRIEDDRKRKVISRADERRLKEGVRDLLYAALRSPEIGNDAFEESLRTAALYPRFGVERRVRPRGRPRKIRDGESQ